MARLEVITGPMFSGKSEELIKRLRRESYAGKRILVVKPREDTRTESRIVARTKNKAGEFEPSQDFPATPIGSREELASLFFKVETDVLGIDEAQFFKPWLADFVRELLEKNFVEKIMVAGLDMDYRGNPFGPMPQLLAMCDDPRKETAVCFRCKKAPAVMTQKIRKSSGEQVEVGDAGLYEARCRACWMLPPDE